MSEGKDLDLSEYDRLVTKHGLFGRARSRMFEDRTHGKAWNVSLASGELVIDGEPHTCQILGTFAPPDGTFLWAWANPGNKDWGRTLEAANQLRTYGDKPGNAVFRERKISDKWVHPEELMAVCGELAGGHPIFCGAMGNGGLAYLLVTSVAPDPRHIAVTHLPGVLLEFQANAMLPMRPCVLRFLQRMEYMAREEGDRTIAEHENGNVITVTWDDKGRLTKVEMTATLRGPP